LIRLSVPEIRKLLLKLVWDRLAPAEQTLAWSDWRRDCSGRLGANRIHGVRFLRAGVRKQHRMKGPGGTC
jgi:hypothetical protein